MAQFVELQFKDGETIKVQVASAFEPAEAGFPAERGFPFAAGALEGETVEGHLTMTTRVVQSAETVLAPLARMADVLREAVAGSVNPPDAVTVRFGVSLEAEAGVLITKASVGATFDVTMEWRRA